MVKLNQTYTTVGGWKAQVVWISSLSHICYVIHSPNETRESPPISHNKYDGKAFSVFSVNEPPKFDKELPSDLIIPLD